LQAVLFSCLGYRTVLWQHYVIPNDIGRISSYFILHFPNRKEKYISSRLVHVCFAIGITISMRYRRVIVHPLQAKSKALMAVTVLCKRQQWTPADVLLFECLESFVHPKF